MHTSTTFQCKLAVYYCEPINIFTFYMIFSSTICRHIQRHLPHICKLYYYVVNIVSKHYICCKVYIYILIRNSSIYRGFKSLSIRDMASCVSSSFFFASCSSCSNTSSSFLRLSSLHTYKTGKVTDTSLVVKLP